VKPSESFMFVVPITSKRIARIRYEEPKLTFAEFVRARMIRPAIEARTPLTTYVVSWIRSTAIRPNRLARAEEPTRYTWKPHGVRVLKSASTAASTPKTRNGTGMPATRPRPNCVSDPVPKTVLPPVRPVAIPLNRVSVPRVMTIGWTRRRATSVPLSTPANAPTASAATTAAARPPAVPIDGSSRVVTSAAVMAARLATATTERSTPPARKATPMASARMPISDIWNAIDARFGYVG
jgi:hypothetical protein